MNAQVTPDVFQELAGLSIWMPHANKHPNNGLGRLSKSVPEHWMTLAKALQLANQYADNEIIDNRLTGVGMVAVDTTVIDGWRLIIIDVDGIDGAYTGVYEQKILDPAGATDVLPAFALVNQIPTYWEASVSGTGLHAYALVPDEWAAMYANAGHIAFPGCHHVEVYTGGAPQYATVTGVPVNGLPVSRLDDAGLALLAGLLKQAEATKVSAANLDLGGGTPFDLTQVSGMSPKHGRMINGAIPVGERNPIVRSLLIALIDHPNGYTLPDIKASVLVNPALLAYFSKHTDPVKFADSEIKGAWALSMTGKRAALYENRSVDPVSASTVPPFEKAPSHGFEAPYLSAMWDDDPAVDWMIYGFLENETIAELWGLSGAYKTFVALDAGAAVASGHDYHGKKVMRQGPVLYIPGEGRKGAMRRLKVLCQERGLGRDLKIRISNRPVFLAQADQAAWLLDEIAKFDVPPALIIIDTLARNFGGNENSTQDMGAFVDSVTTISREIGATVLIVHHCGYDESHARGAYALYAGIDAEYQVTRDGQSVQIINKKMKEAEEGKIICLSAKVVELKNEITGEVINDGEGKPITSIVLHSGGSERAALQTAFLARHKTLIGTRANKYKERFPKMLETAFDNPDISVRAMALACGAGGHDWVKGLQKLMRQEGLIEGNGFKLTGVGKEAARIFCERADFQMNVHNLPERPFPPQKSDLL